MPAKNSIKQYVENGYYHIYNRGVEKRKIFLSQQDYSVFLSYIKTYLTPKGNNELQKKLVDKNISYKERDEILKLLRMNNFYNEISLLSFCLMPNHFHFFIKQNSALTIDVFMNSLLTRYVMYFNRKYNRVGPLFQGVYKAVMVESEPQFVYLSAYIHKNPIVLASKGLALQEQLLSQPSSYAHYLGLSKIEWVNKDEVLSYFSKIDPRSSYQSFVEQTDDFSVISKFLLEGD